MFGCRMCSRDETELTGPEGHRHCDGGAGISQHCCPQTLVHSQLDGVGIFVIQGVSNNMNLNRMWNS